MKKSKIIMFALLPIGAALIYLINFTDVLTPKAEYVRLKNGQEFRDVPVRWPSDVDVVIDGTWYTQYDIDSLVR